MQKTWKFGWPLKLLLVAAVVPVDSLDQWRELKFNKIPANDVQFVDSQMLVKVNKSASPLIHKFKEPKKLKGFKIQAEWSGKLNIPEGKTQGEKGADDFVFKFGLVETGKQTLNWFQKKIAASWILELYKLAPEGTGVRRINFYSTTLQESQRGQSRTHPLSELIYEKRITHLKEPGAFEMQYEFEKPMESLGIWLSIDGDDTDSTYEVKIKSIELL